MIFFLNLNFKINLFFLFHFHQKINNLLLNLKYFMFKLMYCYLSDCFLKKVVLYIKINFLYLQDLDFLSITCLDFGLIK